MLSKWLGSSKAPTAVPIVAVPKVATSQKTPRQVLDDDFRSRGRCMLDIKPDDNCLFGAFAQRFLGNQNRHQDMREKEREFLLAHADDPSYAWMLAEIQAEAAAGGKVFTSVVAYADYIQKPKVWGGEFDIRVLQLANGVDSTVIHTFRNDRICFSVVTPAGDLPTTSKNAIELAFIGGNHWNLGASQHSITGRERPHCQWRETLNHRRKS